MFAKFFLYLSCDLLVFHLENYFTYGGRTVQKLSHLGGNNFFATVRGINLKRGKGGKGGRGG